MTGSDPGGDEVIEIRAADTHALRLAVLRADTPTKDVVFPEDDWPGTWHLGVRRTDAARGNGPATPAVRLVATSSWVPSELDGLPAVQLRGMATAVGLQGQGVGGRLLEAGCAWAADRGFDTVWARARDAALAFYERHGFVVQGEGFVDAATQLPHHLVVRRLAAHPPAERRPVPAR